MESDTNPYLYGRANPLRFMDSSGQQAGPGATAGMNVGCALAVALALENTFPPKTYDKFKHCFISCRMMDICGVVGASAVGIGKEIKDMFGSGDASVADLVADLDGIECALSGRHDPCPDCDNCCASGVGHR